MAACLLAVAMLAGPGCAAPEGRAGALPRPAAAEAGRVEGKLGFTRETGCQNDGSVELCVAKDDAATLEAVRRAAHSVRPAPGGAGRARCDVEREALYLYPTEGSDPRVCSAPGGALTEQAWRELQALAALPGVRAIVPTRYE